MQIGEEDLRIGQNATKTRNKIYDEWAGKAKEVHVPGPNFIWPDGYIGDISNSNLIRISVKGENDTYLAFSEEN